jgi:hypothetical protein
MCACGWRAWRAGPLAGPLRVAVEPDRRARQVDRVEGGLTESWTCGARQVLVSRSCAELMALSLDRPVGRFGRPPAARNATASSPRARNCVSAVCIGSSPASGHAAEGMVLLYGGVPAWRALAEGVSGADVSQLNYDLVRLGYAGRADTPWPATRLPCGHSSSGALFGLAVAPGYLTPAALPSSARMITSRTTTHGARETSQKRLPLDTTARPGRSGHCRESR